MPEQQLERRLDRSLRWSGQSGSTENSLPLSKSNRGLLAWSRYRLAVLGSLFQDDCNTPDGVYNETVRTREPQSTKKPE